MVIQNIILRDSSENKDLFIVELKQLNFRYDMRTKEVGTSSDRGFDGADAWVMYRGKLPDNYITKEEAAALGWKPKQANLAEVAPGKMLGGNLYKNVPEVLPNATGRKWYEADLDYDSGL